VDISAHLQDNLDVSRYAPKDSKHPSLRDQASAARRCLACLHGKLLNRLLCEHICPLRTALTMSPSQWMEFCCPRLQLPDWHGASIPRRHRQAQSVVFCDDDVACHSTIDPFRWCLYSCGPWRQSNCGAPILAHPRNDIKNNIDISTNFSVAMKFVQDDELVCNSLFNTMFMFLGFTC